MKISKYYCIMFYAFFALPASASDRCTWTDDPAIIANYSSIVDFEDGLQNWDVNCKDSNPTFEFMRQCWCDINKPRLVSMMTKINEIEQKFPDFAGKKVCFKVDKVTSRNISFSSSKDFFKRCQL